MKTGENKHIKTKTVGFNPERLKTNNKKIVSILNIKLKL